MSAKKLFISYSHADEEPYLKSLLTHLRPLERRGIVKPWFDGHILPGDELDAKIAAALQGADIIVLLVSPDFLASEYCYTNEMEAAIERHVAATARVIPVIVRDCQWKKAPFSRIKVLPKDGKAIATFSWQNADAAWTSIAEAIEAVAADEGSRPSASPEVAPQATSPPATPPKSTMTVKARATFTDQDRDDFKHDVFDVIAKSFEDAINTLVAPLSGRFRRLDANRFTGTIYNNGSRVAGCTIWVGGEAFSKDSIAYVGNDSGQTNSMNDWLGTEVVDNTLVLQPKMAFGAEKSAALDADGAAEYLWAKFVERLTHR